MWLKLSSFAQPVSPKLLTFLAEVAAVLQMPSYRFTVMRPGNETEFNWLSYYERGAEGRKMSITRGVSGFLLSSLFLISFVSGGRREWEGRQAIVEK